MSYLHHAEIFILRSGNTTVLLKINIDHCRLMVIVLTKIFYHAALKFTLWTVTLVWSLLLVSHLQGVQGNCMEYQQYIHRVHGVSIKL